MLQEDFTTYCNFLKEISDSVKDVDDELALNVCSYPLDESEIPGEVVNWALQYLCAKNCPSALIAPVIKNIVATTREDCQNLSKAYGYDPIRKNFSPSALHKIVISSLRNFCQRLLDNSELNKILPLDKELFTYPKCVARAVRNGRRSMEDRHICIENFNEIFNVAAKESEKASFYGVFDGHDGHHAAYYSVSQLPFILANDYNYPLDPEKALRNAFKNTDDSFSKKCESQRMKGGTTALCALYRPLESKLYVAWVGDSKALVAKNGNITQIVKPHKPDSPEEASRIEQSGGCVIAWAGTYRVNGLLNLSRAIGDSRFKSYVISDPDIVCLELDKEEDFLILACDGLWDYVSENDIAFVVYNQIRSDADNLEEIPQRLIDLAKLKGSSDNITIIVVFLKNVHVISKNSWLEDMDKAYKSACKNIDESSEMLMQNKKSELDLKNDCLAEKPLEQKQLEGLSTDSIENFDKELMQQKYEYLDDPETMFSPEKQRTLFNFGMDPMSCVDTTNVIPEGMKWKSGVGDNESFLTNGKNKFATFAIGSHSDNRIKPTATKLTELDAEYGSKEDKLFDNRNDEQVTNLNVGIANEKPCKISEVKSSDMTESAKIRENHDINNTIVITSDNIKFESADSDKYSEHLLQQEIRKTVKYPAENEGNFTGEHESLSNELMNSQTSYEFLREPVRRNLINKKSEETNAMKLCGVDPKENIHPSITGESHHILNMLPSVSELTMHELSKNIHSLDIKFNNCFEGNENLKTENDNPMIHENEKLHVEKIIVKEKEVFAEDGRQCIFKDMGQEHAVLVINLTPEINDINTQQKVNSEVRNIIPESAEDPENKWKYIKTKDDEEGEIKGNEYIPNNKEILIEYSDKKFLTDEISKVITESQESEKVLESKHKKEQWDSLDKYVPGLTTSQLNPEAKGLIPIPLPLLSDISHSTALTATVHCLNSDDVLAQSSHKGTFYMKDISVPAENDFSRESFYRPSETYDEYDNCYIKTQSLENYSPSELIATKENDKNQSVILGKIQNSSLEIKQTTEIENVFGKTPGLLNSIQTICFDTDVKDKNTSTNDKYIDLGMGDSIKNSEESPLNKVEAMGNGTSDEISPLSESFTNEISDKTNMEINMPSSDLQLIVDAYKLDSKTSLDETEEVVLSLCEQSSINNIENFVVDNKLIDVIPLESKYEDGNLEKSVNLKQGKDGKQEVCTRTNMKTKAASSTKKFAASHEIVSKDTKVKPLVNNLKSKPTHLSTISSRTNIVPGDPKAVSPTEKKILAKRKCNPQSSTAITIAPRKALPKPTDLTKTTLSKATTKTTNPRQITSSKSSSIIGIQPKIRSTNTVTAINIIQNSLPPNSKSSILTSNMRKKNISPRSTLTSTLRKTEAIKNPVSSVSKAPTVKQITVRTSTTNKTTVTSKVGTIPKSAPPPTTATFKIGTSTIQKKIQKQVNTVATNPCAGKVKNSEIVANHLNNELTD